MSKHVDNGIPVGERGEIDDVLRKLKAYFLMKETSELNIGMSQKFLGRVITRAGKGFEITGTEDLILSMAGVLGWGSASGVSTRGVKAEARRDDEMLAPEGAAKFRIASESRATSASTCSTARKSVLAACRSQPPAT